jgi:hypothetical protein
MAPSRPESDAIPLDLAALLSVSIADDAKVSSVVSGGSYNVQDDDRIGALSASTRSQPPRTFACDGKSTTRTTIEGDLILGAAENVQDLFHIDEEAGTIFRQRAGEPAENVCAGLPDRLRAGRIRVSSSAEIAGAKHESKFTLARANLSRPMSLK